jgi:glycosyltransferase involved in cell wall biosynthesis
MDRNAIGGVVASGVEISSPILAFATQGAGGGEEARLRDLLSKLHAEFFPFERSQKRASALQILQKMRSRRYGLAIMEGTGIAGGLAIILAKWLYGAPYIVSSGDAVAPYLTSRWPLGKWVFTMYERLLCGNSAGFIGWTPYLVGRAKDLGAPRGMTAAGWAPYLYGTSHLAESRVRVRRSLGIPGDAIVFGITGWLFWNKRLKYCYGHELVQAAIHTSNPAVCVLVVGDGDGLSELQRMAGSRLNTTIFLPGRIPREEVPDYLAAMDVASLPQSVDNLGSFRYTTKLPEYFSVRLPIITNQIPAAYDLDYGQIWRLPGRSPWDPTFVRSLVDLMDGISSAAIEKKRAAIQGCLPEFDRDRQIARTTAFVQDILEDRKPR